MFILKIIPRIYMYLSYVCVMKRIRKSISSSNIKLFYLFGVNYFYVVYCSFRNAVIFVLSVSEEKKHTQRKMEFSWMIFGLFKSYPKMELIIITVLKCLGIIGRCDRVEIPGLSVSCYLYVFSVLSSNLNLLYSLIFSNSFYTNLKKFLIFPAPFFFLSIFLIDEELRLGVD